jgi:hypothetical protein
MEVETTIPMDTRVSDILDLETDEAEALLTDEAIDKVKARRPVVAFRKSLKIWLTGYKEDAARFHKNGMYMDISNYIMSVKYKKRREKKRRFQYTVVRADEAFDDDVFLLKKRYNFKCKSDVIREVVKFTARNIRKAGLIKRQTGENTLLGENIAIDSGLAEIMLEITESYKKGKVITPQLQRKIKAVENCLRLDLRNLAD